MTWNANSLFKRIRNGDFARMLNDHAADLIHITEVKGAPGNDMAASELRQVLFALGYIHIVWNWCTKTPFNHGSAVFSKVPIDKVEFGIEGTGEDNEGRTITTHFPGSAQVWTYTPCSSMYVADVEERRQGYNTGFKRHVRRTQRDRGEGRVLVAGDMNVAPRATDARVPRHLEGLAIPSTKAYEREDWRTLCEEANLADAADTWEATPSMTWQKPGKSGFTMRIDHVLVPRPRAQQLGETIDDPALTSFSVGPITYNSDHRPLRFSYELPQANPTKTPVEPKEPIAAAPSQDPIAATTTQPRPTSREEPPLGRGGDPKTTPRTRPQQVEFLSATAASCPTITTMPPAGLFARLLALTGQQAPSLGAKGRGVHQRAHISTSLDARVHNRRTGRNGPHPPINGAGVQPMHGHPGAAHKNFMGYGRVLQHDVPEHSKGPGAGDQQRRAATDFCPGRRPHGTVHGPGSHARPAGSRRLPANRIPNHRRVPISRHIGVAFLPHARSHHQLRNIDHRD